MSVQGGSRSRRGRPGRKNLAGPLLPGDGPLARIPPVAVFAAVAVVFAVGVVVGGVIGAVLLGVLALGVAGLLVTTWPRQTSSERAGRLLILAVLVVVAVTLVVRGGTT